MCFVGIFPKIREILVKIHTFAVVWLNDGLFAIGSFVWWSKKIFRLFLIFAISDALCVCFICKKCIYNKEHYQMCFVLKCSSFTLYVVFLIAIHHGFAFNYTNLQISCVLLASKTDANANLKKKKKITGISHS